MSWNQWFVLVLAGLALGLMVWDVIVTGRDLDEAWRDELLDDTEHWDESDS